MTLSDTSSPVRHDVRLDRRGRVSVLTLDRPEVRNAMSGRMLRDLVDAIAEADRCTETEVIVLTGAGSAFCAGDDLREAARTDAQMFDANIAVLQRATALLLESDKASIAAVNGPAVGGGLELTLACDLRIAAETARFACPEVSWGLVFTNGASVLLPALIGAGRAREMVLLGRTYDAGWALSAGLVNEVVPADGLLDRALEMAEGLADCAPAVYLTRELLRAPGSSDVAQALRRELDAVGKARRSALAERKITGFVRRSGGGAGADAG